MPFQRPTITSEEVPTPSVKRPGAGLGEGGGAHRERRRAAREDGDDRGAEGADAGAQAAASASGVKPSVPLASLDQRSL